MKKEKAIIKDVKPLNSRYDMKKKAAIAKASDNERCWWLAQYLRRTL